MSEHPNPAEGGLYVDDGTRVVRVDDSPAPAPEPAETTIGATPEPEEVDDAR